MCERVGELATQQCIVARLADFGTLDIFECYSDRSESADGCSWPGANLMAETPDVRRPKGQVAIVT